ncbi:hypothetical protein BZA05DRAFT_156195 [Tricharina praecox]|uniref:uncharacterized protein n=1 Tax=Tricharina praecox TaxID=43433 RepID=UPI0022210536|nr:uncharacterized protein BZA05DRAFT_156195 [Tricharina praecox]KAI5844709.1 hypothetical protein BZA05DRAFT_156195 [Tricharina praecox]
MASSTNPSSIQLRRLGRLALGVLFFAFALTCLTTALQHTFTSNTPTTLSIHRILHNWGLSPSTYWRTLYPTSFTRDIYPKPIHSHNDYWRRVPFYSAISVGAISVEADVWEYSGELYVGHDTASLTRNRTFGTLYVTPIREILDEMNQAQRIPIGSSSSEEDEAAVAKPLRGIFDVDPEQTLHLYVDIKTPGASTLPVVIQQLEPLRSPRNFLTHWNGTHLVRGQVTVHLSGAAPFELMLQHEYRDYFYDAPLSGLASGRYNTSNSLMATASFRKEIGAVYWGSGGLSRKMKDKIAAQIKAAHERGIGVRYWSTPMWPISVRNQVWGTLVEMGVDLLNVNDLKAATEMKW